MLKISRLADYGTVLVQRLVLAVGHSISAAELSEHTHIAHPTVCKVLKLLAESGLVVSQRGVHGGYRLARLPEEINLYDVVSAIDGPVALTECAVDGGQCVHGAVCPLRGNWQTISQLVVLLLSSVTLASMARPFHLEEVLNQFIEHRNPAIIDFTEAQCRG